MSTDTENISILGLAESILEKTKDITKYLQANNFVAPTFSSVAGNLPRTADYQKLQSDLRTSLEDLQRLVDADGLRSDGRSALNFLVCDGEHSHYFSS